MQTVLIRNLHVQTERRRLGQCCLLSVFTQLDSEPGGKSLSRADISLPFYTVSLFVLLQIQVSFLFLNPPHLFFFFYFRYFPSCQNLHPEGLTSQRSRIRCLSGVVYLLDQHKNDSHWRASPNQWSAGCQDLRRQTIQDILHKKK